MKSTNISQQKKRKILHKLNEIKRICKKSSSSSQISKYFKEITNYIENFKFGLVFERHQEEIERILNTNEINLVQSINFSIDGDNLDHMIIEGENLAALTYLQNDFRSKIDVIFIDPPYNTGNYKLRYNDQDYLDYKDEYSHSKWLSFMKKRLEVAMGLLSAHGLVFINIDETQIGCLILLCQDLFGEENVDILIWPKTDKKYDANRVEKSFHNVKVVHEYIILCYKNKKDTTINKMRKRPNHSDFLAQEGDFDLESIIYETGTTSSAKDEITEIFDSRDSFTTPKPMKLIKELVRVATTPNSIVLDIFAGSGTTGHAVIDLNQEDHGNRKFILVNNNENDICRRITYKRIKWVFNHYKSPNSLKYYQVQYSKPKV